MYLFTGIGRIRAVLTGGKFVARMLFSPFKPRAGQCHDSFLQNVNLCRCAKISIYSVAVGLFFCGSLELQIRYQLIL